MTQAQVAAFINDDIVRWPRFVREANIQAD